MKIQDFLNSEELTLPKKRNGQQIIDFVQNCFKLFQKQLDQLDLSSKFKNWNYYKDNIAKKLSDTILESFKFFLSGRQIEAYTVLESFLEKPCVKRHLRRLYSKPLDNKILQINRMLRLRADISDFPCSSKELFHLPKHLCSKIASARFSIPGVPCLYMSYSSYAAWKEIGQPELSKIYACRFQPAENIKLKVLDLAMTPKCLSEAFHESKSNYNYEAAFILFWPLRLATSLIVDEPDSGFKPEYIIPQLIMQYIQKPMTKIDGIRYLSTKIPPPESNSIQISVNYAFPIREYDKDGYCKILKNKLIATPPISFISTYVCNNFSIDTNDTGDVYISDLSSKYKETEFFKFDNILIKTLPKPII